MSKDLVAEYRRIVQEGLGADAHRYDHERFEELDKIADRLDGDRLVPASMIEALAKTGWSLTRSDENRNRYAELIEIAAQMGASFFGPATPPRTEIDDTLAAVSSRYVTPKVGVYSVVDDGSGRLLMVQRADRGEWSIPGGYADVGLSGAGVAVKEAKEETGYDVEVRTLLGEYNNLQHGGQRVPQYTLIYHCWVIGGAPKPHPEEVLDLKWVKRPEVPEKLWCDGDPWLEIALRAVEGVKQEPYFDKP